MKPGSKEWLQMRRTKIGASDAPIIMGVSPWGTPRTLYEKKIFNIEEPDNEYMARGRRLEPIALQAFEDLTGHIAYSMIMFHDHFDWMIATMDGMTLDKKIGVEIKCPGKRDHFLALHGRVPEKYYPQLQHQMEVCQLEEINYFSFDGERGVNVVIQRDQKYIEELLEKEQEFWYCLSNLKSPY